MENQYVISLSESAFINLAKGSARYLYNKSKGTPIFDADFFISINKYDIERLEQICSYVSNIPDESCDSSEWQLTNKQLANDLLCMYFKGMF